METKTVSKKSANKVTGKKSKKYADNKDRTKLKFNGKTYGKGRAVQAVIEKFVEDNPTITLTQLQEKFPQGVHSMGLIQTISKAKKLSKGHRRFYIDKPIKLADGKQIAVCSEFGANNIGKFLDAARELGYTPKPVRA